MSGAGLFCTSPSHADLWKPGCPCPPVVTSLSTFMLEITIQYVFQLSSICLLPMFSVFISLNKANVGCLVSYRRVGESILPFTERLTLHMVWLHRLGWPDHETLGAKSWRRPPSFLEHRTRGAAIRWHWLCECWQNCFVKAHEGSERRPVLHQTSCC